jgi:hypothetical protein
MDGWMDGWAGAAAKSTYMQVSLPGVYFESWVMLEAVCVTIKRTSGPQGSSHFFFVCLLARCEVMS